MTKKLRLWTGLVLFAFVTTHLLNHALGILSLQAMDDGREVFLVIWRNWPMTAVLLGSIGIHIALALWALYRRRSLRMHPWEAAQLILGLLIPFQLVEHVVGTRVLHEVFGTRDNYEYILSVFYLWDPTSAVLQISVMLIAWLHGVIGIHYWIRLKPWHRAWAPWLQGLALLVPLLALAGIHQGGQEIRHIAENRELYEKIVAAMNLPAIEDVQGILFVKSTYQFTFGGLIVLVLVARFLRSRLLRLRGVVRLTYPGGRLVDVLPGISVLEASRTAGIPHASVCGGRGRCSTCRVRVGQGADLLAEPTTDEHRVLERIGAPPNVRLACQIEPTAPLEVTPLLPPHATPRDGYRRPAHLQGREKTIAILFADLRAFTKFSETKLPYDVVFVLNRYFAAMGEAVKMAGGHLDKFIGDGVMALFGVDTDPETACRQAIAAARNMALQLQALNTSLVHDLDQPLRIGVGIHVGPAIIGEMGYERATSLTAIGDAVNTASRLEAMTKEFGAQVVLSHRVETTAHVDLGAFPTETVEIRGRNEPLEVRVIARGIDLPETLKGNVMQERRESKAPAPSDTNPEES